MDPTEYVNYVKFAFLLAFVLFIPASAACYHVSRSEQREAEIKRYMEILKIKQGDRKLFEQQSPGLSLFISVSFATFLTACFWSLIMFGSDIKFATEYNYLLGNTDLVQKIKAPDGSEILKYQNGALLTFNMAFLGAYLWGIQNLTRRYAMNDLIPITYYNLGVRMIFATILALVIYNLSEAAPDMFASIVAPANAADDPPSDLQSTHVFTPILAFLVGMFPQRALNWLTNKFSVFSQKHDESVRDLPLDMVEGITVYDRVRLQELGIDDCYDLANVDYIPCLFKTPYSPRALISWILQAKMCVYFGEHVKDLREQGIHTVWQINKYEVEKLKELVKSSSLTEDKLVRVKKLITEDHEIERLVAAQKLLSQYWSITDEEITDITGEPARHGAGHPENKG